MLLAKKFFRIRAKDYHGYRCRNKRINATHAETGFTKNQLRATLTHGTYKKARNKAMQQCSKESQTVLLHTNLLIKNPPLSIMPSQLWNHLNNLLSIRKAKRVH